MSSLTFLLSELQSLATESRRRYPDVREAADKAISLLRANADVDLSNSNQLTDDLLRPVIVGCGTKNAKVVAIALGCLQRLTALKAVPLRALPQILSAMSDTMSLGVDIQLRILQALSSLITSFPEVHGSLLGDSLLLCFRLQESKIAVVSSTAAATLRQLVMYVFEKVIINQKRQAMSQSYQTITLPDGSSASLQIPELDAYRVFEDLCLLANSERPNFLRIDSLPKTFALELIESVLTNYYTLFHKSPEILLLMHQHLCPLLIKALSERPLFPLTLRSTRVVYILLKQFSDELETETEVFAMMLIKMVSGEDSTADGGRRPHWMRVLATEVIRGVCTDSELVRRYWKRYDDHSNGSHVFTSLITALKRLVTEKPALLGVSAVMQGLGVHSDGPGAYGLEQVAGIVANAATTTVSGALGIQSSAVGLNPATSSLKVPCIDQLDKADAPMIPEGYIYFLGLQCLVSLAEGFVSHVMPPYASLVSRNLNDTESMRLLPAISFESLQTNDPRVSQLLVEKRMIESGWPALLAALSFLIGTNLSDDLFIDVLTALQALTHASGVLGLHTPRDAFLTSLSKLAIPARVVSKLDSWVEPPMTPRVGSAMGVVDGLAALAGGASAMQAPALSDRNIACLKVIVSSAIFLGGSLGSSWFNVLEALQNADYVLTAKGMKYNTGRQGFNSGSSAIQRSSSTLVASITSSSTIADQTQLLSNVEPEQVLASIQGLFEATKQMDDTSFNHFSVALCKLSAEMIGMQVSADMEEGPESSVSPSSPTVAHAHRRRVSGIQLTRTPRSGDFSVNKLGAISLLNINRLVYLDPKIAWDPITTHLITVLLHPLAPSPLRIQAAQNLDDILVIVPRHLEKLEVHVVTEVQRRALEVLSVQVLTEGNSPTVIDIRKMGLETLHSILQNASHTLLVGWEVILEMLASVCKPATTNLSSVPFAIHDGTSHFPPTPTVSRTRLSPLDTSVGDKQTDSLVRVAFGSLSLVCDTLLSLSPDQLKLCISTLGLFGRQNDTNIALTAAESLLWAVSDSIQLRRKDPTTEPQYSELWMVLLGELLSLCTDARPEVRGGSIQTLSRTLQLYGSTLSLETWDRCMWQVVFPLLDSLQTAAAHTSPGGAERSQVWHEAWDDSKILALQSVGGLFHDFLMSKLLMLATFEEVWNGFVQRIQEITLKDGRSIGVVALRALEQALKAVKDTSGPNKAIADSACERVWTTWETIGLNVQKQSAPVEPTKAFTQDILLAFVDVVKALRALSKHIRGFEWQLERLSTLMSILNSVMTYSMSPEYRPDIDALTPLQSDIFEVLDSVDLLVPGFSSILLKDLSGFVTLAFSRGYSEDNKGKGRKLTYIAVSKRTIPQLSQLYLRFKGAPDIYADGTVEAIFTALALPIKLKYNCPAPSKFGSDVPLWKTATVNFLTVVKECAPRVAHFEEVTDDQVTKIWASILDVFEGGLLADCSMAAENAEDEEFDHAFIVNVEAYVYPNLGHPRIPEDIISNFGKVLQHASKIHEPQSITPLPLLDDSSDQASVVTVEGDSTSKNRKGFDEAELLDVVSLTVRTHILPRERFSYWCFDLLILLCSRNAIDNHGNRQRVAALCLPSLLARWNQVLLRYVLDNELHGDMPFSRAREEEVIYVLNKMLRTELWPDSLWNALFNSSLSGANGQPDGSVSIKNLAYRSKRAHLFYCYDLLVRMASAPKASSAWLPDFTSDSKEAGEGSITQEVSPSIAHFNSRDLAASCLRLLGEEMGLPFS